MAPPVALLFERVDDAERRIGGLCAAARQIRQVGEAGAGAVTVVLGDGGQLGQRCLDDIARVAGDVRWSVGGRGEARSISIDGGVLPVDPEPLRALMSGGAATLVWRGRRIAWHAPEAGEPRRLLDEDQAIDLSDPAAATWQLLLRTGKAADGPVSRRLNRPVSRRISAFLLKFGSVRPDHVTAFAALIAVAMFGLLLLGGPALVVVGALLFHVGSVIDGVDGEMARVSFRSSVRGAVLDMWVDRTSILLFLLGTTIAAGRLHGAEQAAVGLWGFGAAALGVAILSRAVRHLPPPRGYDILLVRLRERFPAGPGRAVLDAIAVLIGRDVFSFALPMLALLFPIYVVTWAFSAFATLWLGAIIVMRPSILRPGGAVAAEGLNV